MKKWNEILAVILLTLVAVLVAAIGLRAYNAYVFHDQARQERREQEQVLARNREANDRVREMRQEIQALSEDREKLAQFLEEIQAEPIETAAVPVSMMADAQESGMSGSLSDSDMSSMSDNTTYVSDNMTNMSDNEILLSEQDTISDNTRFVSENNAISENTPSLSDNNTASENTLPLSGSDTVSGNMLSLSGNDTASGNTLSLSGNDTVSEDTLSLSGNDTVSENTLSVSGNDTISGNMLSVSGNAMVSPKISLEERRKSRSSSEETLLVNREDVLCLAKRQTDFSGKKIACLGDSITAAANLEEEEGYLSYAYPAVLKELLGAEEVYNLGIGGSAIGRYWSDAFVERYTQIPQDTDIIIVMGGTNDGFCLSEKEFGSLAERKPWTFCGDLDELMRGLKEHYPDADIFFVTPLPNILHDYLMRERAYLLPQKNLADVILTLSAAHEFRVIDLYNANILDSHDADIVADYMPDGVHANKAGYRILAEHIAAELVRNYEGTE